MAIDVKVQPPEQVPDVVSSDDGPTWSRPWTTFYVSGRDKGVSKPRRRMSDGRVVLVWVLAVLSGLLVWGALFATVLSSVQEAHAQRLGYDTLREQLPGLADTPAPTGGQITPGTPVAIISAPTAGIVDVAVLEGTTSTQLAMGPGHRRDTVLPGQAGVAVIYGKSLTSGAPFGQIGSMVAGDAISVTTAQGEFSYKVTDVRFEGDPLPTVLANGHGRLTLVSSTGDGWLRGAPTRTVYVDADLEGDGLASPPGRVSSISDQEELFSSDPSALLPLVFWLQLLLVTVLAAVWAWLRWGRWQTWVVGMPVILAVLWGTTSAASLLLPNVL